jgi:hypothetical protein
MIDSSGSSGEESKRVGMGILLRPAAQMIPDRGRSGKIRGLGEFAEQARCGGRVAEPQYKSGGWFGFISPPRQFFAGLRAAQRR